MVEQAMRERTHERPSRYGIDYHALAERLRGVLRDDPRTTGGDAPGADYRWAVRQRLASERAVTVHVERTGRSSPIISMTIREYSVYPDDREPRCEYTVLAKRWHDLAHRLDAIVRETMPEAFWELLDREDAW